MVTFKTLLILYWNSNESSTSSVLPVKYHQIPQGHTVLSYFSFPVIFLLNHLFVPTFNILCASGPCKSLLFSSHSPNIALPHLPSSFSQHQCFISINISHPCTSEVLLPKTVPFSLKPSEILVIHMIAKNDYQ